MHIKILFLIFPDKNKVALLCSSFRPFFRVVLGGQAKVLSTVLHRQQDHLPPWLLLADATSGDWVKQNHWKNTGVDIQHLFVSKLNDHPQNRKRSPHIGNTSFSRMLLPSTFQQLLCRTVYPPWNDHISHQTGRWENHRLKLVSANVGDMLVP